jgi:hypothetical protein
MRITSFIVLLFALLFCTSSAFKIGNPVKTITALAKCTAEAAPYLAPLGACIAIPNPMSCVNGVHGAQQFLSSCCGTLKSGGNGVANQLKQLCSKLSM